MPIKEIISSAAVILILATYIYYLVQIMRRRMRPHLFSWIIWGILTTIGFAVQYAEDAGSGMWVLAASAAFGVLIIIAACFHGEKNITKSDWAAFIMALAAIPIWRATNDPFWATIIICVIDSFAFYPTFRKSWHRPHEESVFLFFIGMLPFLMSIFALDKVTVTTALYPAIIVMWDVALSVMLVYRRRVA